MTPNEQLAVMLPGIVRKIARARFLREHWVSIRLDDAELLADAAADFLKDLILPEEAA